MTRSSYADNHVLAVAGEGFACGVYEGAGYELLGSRVRLSAGELDLVMQSPEGDIVFVEVKTRRGRSFGAAEAVTAKKLATMRRCAAEWLKSCPAGEWAAVRFDVAEVVFRGDEIEIEIYEDVENGAG